MLTIQHVYKRYFFYFSIALLYTYLMLFRTFAKKYGMSDMSLRFGYSSWLNIINTKSKTLDHSLKDLSHSII